MTWYEVEEFVINARGMVSAEEDETAYTGKTAWFWDSIEINWSITEQRVECSRYLETESFLLPSGSMLDGKWQLRERIPLVKWSCALAGDVRSAETVNL